MLYLSAKDFAIIFTGSMLAYMDGLVRPLLKLAHEYLLCVLELCMLSLLNTNLAR